MVMDKDKSNQDDIIIPQKSSKTPVYDSSAKKHSADNMNSAKNKKIIPVVVGSVVLLGVLLLVIGLLSKKENNPEDFSADTTLEGESTSPDVEVTYSTPDDSEDPVGDFTEHLEEEKASASTDEEKFDAEVRIISFNIAVEEFDKAEAGLNALAEQELTLEQTFRLYNGYVALYEANGNNEKFDEYTQKAAETRNLLINGSGDE